MQGGVQTVAVMEKSSRPASVIELSGESAMENRKTMLAVNVEKNVRSEYEARTQPLGEGYVVTVSRVTQVVPPSALPSMISGSTSAGLLLYGGASLQKYQRA
jgi:hypothetical protein